MITPFVIAAVMLAGAVTAGAATAKGPDQLLVCEYVVQEPGTGGWDHSQFYGGVSNTYYWPHVRVWGLPGTTWNKNAGVNVKQLWERGNYWVYADKLRRTSARCLPL
ncbi:MULTISPECIES: hypothetical protein [unclassified Crossiella]|uniref:hypothetical protein n=1 Tax=unclassified Crossiella TaxID=2620835 RepID=UPI001FFEDA59|nr:MULTISPECIES: hypothetical protein [unclassified Crossiella]MCK2240922.1 hypothetical protein [Crossiella sp. S99.2]MCK2253934.1 hypothetical protein [Crossiella sp. S99.1]